MFLRWGGFLLVCALFLAACSPQPESQVDELKDPYYLLGKRLVRERDYRGAADAFEKALEANPRSAPAHFELALLYEERLSDPAVALYHYKQTLRYKPDGGTTDIAMARIKGCEQEIAKNVALVPVDPGLVADLDRLKEENRRLIQDLEATRMHLALAMSGTTNRVTPRVVTDPVLTNPFPPRGGSGTNATSTPNSGSGTRSGGSATSRSTSTPRSSTPTSPNPSTSTTTPSGTSRSTPPPRGIYTPLPDPRTKPMRTHYVRQGETFSAVARQYGVSMSALRAANPTLSPERLRVGQPINIPPR